MGKRAESIQLKVLNSWRCDTLLHYLQIMFFSHDALYFVYFAETSFLSGLVISINWLSTNRDIVFE